MKSPAQKKKKTQPAKSPMAYSKKKSQGRRKKPKSPTKRRASRERSSSESASVNNRPVYGEKPFLYLCLVFEKCRDHIVWFWLELCFDFVKNLSRDHRCFVVSLVLSVRIFNGGTSGGW